MRAAAARKSGPRRSISPTREPGSSASTGRSGSRPSVRAGADRIGFERHLVGQRMADETRIDAMARIDRRFHREQAQHAIGAASDLLRAPLAPGPYRRAHVMHGAHAALLQPLLHAEVEVGRVDADEHIGLPGQHSRRATRAAGAAGGAGGAVLPTGPSPPVREASNQASRPAPRIASPPMPANSASGKRLRSSSIRPAPSRSPEASPATRAMRLGRASPAGCDRGGAGLDKADSAWRFAWTAILPLYAMGGVAHRVPVRRRCGRRGRPPERSAQQRALAASMNSSSARTSVAVAASSAQLAARFVQRRRRTCTGCGRRA